MIMASLRRPIAAARRAALLWLCLAATLLAQPARAEMMWGANGHPFTAYPGISFDQQLAYLHDLGLKSYRVNISEMSSAGALAELIRKAEPLGIAILPVLTPVLDYKTMPPEILHAKARDFAFALVSRFKGKIRVWELGNELEIYAIIQPCEMQDDGKQYNCAWGPAGGVGPNDYYGPRWAKVSAAMKGMSEGAMAADPTVLKAMGTAGWGHLGAFERMKADGIAWDISVWHMYGEDPEWAFKTIAQYGKPIWVTEMNQPFGSQKGERPQAEGLKRWMERLGELGPAYRVEAVHIYELLDETYWAPDGEAYMGLVRIEKSPGGGGGWQPSAPKRAYDVVRTIARGQPTGSEAQRDCALEEAGAGKPLAEQQLDYGFCLLLGRAPQPADRQTANARRAEGAKLPALLDRMARSPEFAQRHRLAFLTDAGFVTFLYRMLLGRDPDGQGLGDYTGQLEEGKLMRADLLSAVLGSDEFKARHPLLFREAG